MSYDGRDNDRDDLLRDARECVVDRHGGRIITDLRDHWARFGWLIEMGGADHVLVAKYETHDGLVSFSKPALAQALERGAYLALWNDTAECIRVFDSEWVRAEGDRRTIPNEKAGEIGVLDVSPTAGVPASEFVRGDHPTTLGETSPTTLGVDG